MRTCRKFVALLAAVALIGCGHSNQAPTVIGVTADPDTVPPDNTSTIQVDATDPDGDSLTYTWSTDIGELHGSGQTVTFGPYATQEDVTAHISVIVDDGHGHQVTAGMSLLVGGLPDPL